MVVARFGTMLKEMSLRHGEWVGMMTRCERGKGAKGLFESDIYELKGHWMDSGRGL